MNGSTAQLQAFAGIAPAFCLNRVGASFPPPRPPPDASQPHCRRPAVDGLPGPAGPGGAPPRPWYHLAPGVRSVVVGLDYYTPIFRPDLAADRRAAACPITPGVSTTTTTLTPRLETLAGRLRAANPARAKWAAASAVDTGAILEATTARRAGMASPGKKHDAHRPPSRARGSFWACCDHGRPGL